MVRTGSAARARAPCICIRQLESRLTTVLAPVRTMESVSYTHLLRVLPIALGISPGAVPDRPHLGLTRVAAKSFAYSIPEGFMAGTLYLEWASTEGPDSDRSRDESRCRGLTIRKLSRCGKHSRKEAFRRIADHSPALVRAASQYFRRIGSGSLLSLIHI